MRRTASVLHLDLDAFFASVEQRDKPSLRGRPVVVGGIGGRGVVSTASYEARVFGVRSAMPMAEARRRAPHAAYLSGRFDAYRQSSRVVMAALRELSPLVEQLSVDEAYVDLEAADVDVEDAGAVQALAAALREQVRERTDGLTASVGIGSSKFMAKVASELAKPDGLVLVPPGEESATIEPLSARAIPGVGPATMEKLARLGVRTVADLQRLSLTELSREIGGSWGAGLHALAHGHDDRPVVPEREVKSISVEDTFEQDVTERWRLRAVLDRDAGTVTRRLQEAGLFARTVTIKVRLGDFTTWTRSRTLTGGIDSAGRVAAIADELLAALDLRGGVRLLGVGLSGFVQAAQEELFVLHGTNGVDAGIDTQEYTPQDAGSPGVPGGPDAEPVAVRRHGGGWLAGQDIEHATLGRGWVWGAGHGRVTARFETRLTGVGPVRSFAADDPDLRRPEALLPLPGEHLTTSGDVEADRLLVAEDDNITMES